MHQRGPWVVWENIECVYHPFIHICHVILYPLFHVVFLWIEYTLKMMDSLVNRVPTQRRKSHPDHWWYDIILFSFIDKQMKLFVSTANEPMRALKKPQRLLQPFDGIPLNFFFSFSFYNKFSVTFSFPHYLIWIVFVL